MCYRSKRNLKINMRSEFMTSRASLHQKPFSSPSHLSAGKFMSPVTACPSSPTPASRMWCLLLGVSHATAGSYHRGCPIYRYGSKGKAGDSDLWQRSGLRPSASSSEGVSQPSFLLPPVGYALKALPQPNNHPTLLRPLVFAYPVCTHCLTGLVLSLGVGCSTPTPTFFPLH